MTEVATEALAVRQQRAARRRATVDGSVGVPAGAGVRDTRPSRASVPAPARSSANGRSSSAPGKIKAPRGSKGSFGSSIKIKPFEGPHTGALFAEYFAAALIIVLALFTETATKGYSATISKVMLRLTALTMVFFVLFLMQGSKRGAQAAIYLGLLIDLGVIYSAAQEQLFSTTAAEVTGKGTGVQLDSAGGLSDGSGKGLDVPPEPVGVTLPSE